MKVEANKTYIGVVEDNKDPKKMGRCRVRVLDVFDNIDVQDIPWASPYKDLNGNQFNVPEKGKVLIVVFDQGNQYKPEFISADHYNTNLEKKLESLSDSDYTSMKSLLFDHKTQVYVNDSEGLKLDHKYNNINIRENSIDINLKDNNRNVNIGDATAGQQAILGNNWLDWFDEFVDVLMKNSYLGNQGAPVTPTPSFIKVMAKYQALRDPKFLSHHIKLVDNNKVSTVKNTKREDNPQLGDSWNSTKVENKLTEKTSENFKPLDGPKPEYDDKHVEPSINTPAVPNTPVVTNPITASSSSILDVVNPSSPDVKPVNTTPPLEPLSSPLSNPKIDKMIRFMKSKNYTVYEEIGVLNILSMQNAKKDTGEISNKFDDTMNIFMKNDNGNWDLFEYQITTMPGYVPKSVNLPLKVPFLALGQYIEQCTLQYVNDKNPYIRMSECIMHINNVSDKYDYKSPKITTKNIGFIHPSSELGSAENVYNYSSGAQVFKTKTQFEQFIKLCEKQSIKNKYITYTLCKNSDFDSYI